MWTTEQALRTRVPHGRRLTATAVGALLAIGVAGCGSDTTSTATTSTTTAMSGGSSTSTSNSSASTTAAGSTGGARLDKCAQTTPDLVATTFVSSINYAGADTYMQCVYQDTVAASIGATIKAKNFSGLTPTIDASTNTYVFTAPDGSKLTLVLTKEANGKFYVTSAVLG